LKKRHGRKKRGRTLAKKTIEGAPKNSFGLNRGGGKKKEAGGGESYPKKNLIGENLSTQGSRGGECTKGSSVDGMEKGGRRGGWDI